MPRDNEYRTIHDYVEGYSQDFKEYGYTLEAGIYSVLINNDGDKKCVAVSPYALEDILKFMPITNCLNLFQKRVIADLEELRRLELNVPQKAFEMAKGDITEYEHMKVAECSDLLILKALDQGGHA